MAVDPNRLKRLILYCDNFFATVANVQTFNQRRLVTTYSEFTYL